MSTVQLKHTDQDVPVSTRQLNEKHIDYIKRLRDEMHECLRKSEEARDLYYASSAAYKDRGLSGFELDQKLKEDRIAQGAVADSQLYDRWTTKYATVITAELAMYNTSIH